MGILPQATIERIRTRFEENIFYSPDGYWYWTGTTLKSNHITYGRIGINY